MTQSVMPLRSSSGAVPPVFVAMNSAEPPGMPLLSPYNAWRIVVKRTGINCGRSTFYRWVSSGKVFSLRLGARIFIPWVEVERVIRQCRGGERL